MAPFHPEAVNAMLGRLRWNPDGRLETFIVPVHVEPAGRPVLASGNRAREICEYISAVTTAGGLARVHIDEDGCVRSAEE